MLATMQLDIFADNRVVMLRNDVLDALHQRDAVSARQAWQRLAGEFHDDDTLGGLATSIDSLGNDVPVPYVERLGERWSELRVTPAMPPHGLNRYG